MATAAAAMTARARREIQHHFFSADAVRPDRAVAFEPGNHFEQRQFERLRASDIIREASPGHYWLDMPAYDDMLQERHKRVRWAMLLVLVLLVAWMIFFGMVAAAR